MKIIDIRFMGNAISYQSVSERKVEFVFLRDEGEKLRVTVYGRYFPSFISVLSPVEELKGWISWEIENFYVLGDIAKNKI